MVPIIETQRLRKVFRARERRPGLGGAVRALIAPRYEEKVAVDDVSLAIEPGELVGFLGPNGAGKSTTIKMLTGILVPTSGSVTVRGIVPHKRREANARNIGVVFGQRSQLYWDLPLRESFRLLRAVYEVPRDRFRANLARFVELLELDRFLDTPVRQLSLGERMRADFAAALLHDPPVVFLDEPTIGLDVLAKEAIRGFIERVNAERGTTVLLTTHDLADVERLAERVILIDDGVVIFDGPLERLRAEYGTHRTLVVTLAGAYPKVAVEGAEVVAQDGVVVRLRFDRRLVSAETLIRRVMDRYAINDFSLEEPDIDGIVRRIYVEGYTERGPAAVT